jgi:hypothetical protein
MNNSKRELLLDCLSQLWALSRKAEDYWKQVASLEWEEGLSFFSSLLKHPQHIENYFGKISQEENQKIKDSFELILNKPRSQNPGFFQISLWASLIEMKSQTLRREVFRTALILDQLSRKMIGSPIDMTAKELSDYLELSKKFTSLSKHIHPAFSHSDFPLSPQSSKKEAAEG